MTHEPHAVLATAAGRTMSLKRVDARGRVAGLLLSMTVRQHFRNDTDETLEGVCTFPLAWGAVLLGLSAELAGRRLDGAVLARPEADARYEEAVAAGDAPIRLRKGPDGLFTVDLGNLKPGETADIELRYAQPLRVEQGRVRLSVPTTIAPRCGDMAAQPGMRPHDTTAASLSADYGFTLSLDLDATAAAGPIESPTHAIAVAARPDGGARVSIDGRAWLDRDFVLAFAGGAQAMGTARALRAPDGAGCVVMASFCPAIDGGDRAALDLKLLVDCSGSMAGDSIASARRGLERVLAALRPADRVSFSRFGSTVRHVLDALQPADGPTLERLHREVGATDATMGGTELNAALVSTFSLRGARTGSKADVLLVTDGQVADIEPVVAAARASGQRIFAV
ncbi:MAG: VIT and VWA domain-containing protein, partial [Burkholderiales bacterium]